MKRGIVLSVLAVVVSLMGAAAVDIDACQTISVSDTYTLIANIASNTTCLSVTAGNVSIDCAGFTIVYDLAGTSSDGVPNVGVRVQNNNVTVQNCNIADGNSSGQSGFGVWIESSADATVFNNTIQTNGTIKNTGVRASLTGSLRPNVTQNTIYTFGTGAAGANFGVEFQQAANGVIAFNTINSGGLGNLNHGVHVINQGNASVYNNTIFANGSNGNNGVRITSNAHNSRVFDNIINATGFTGGGQEGVSVSSTSHNVSVFQNQIWVTGTQANNGVSVAANVNNATIHNNSVTVRGTGNRNVGIVFTNSVVQGSTISFNTIVTNGTNRNQCIKLDGAVQNNLVEHNVMTCRGDFDNFGITLSDPFLDGAFNNTVQFNTVTTYGNDSHGLRAANGIVNTSFIANNITVVGIDSFGAFVGIPPQSSNPEIVFDTVFEDNILVNVTQWIQLISADNVTIRNMTYATEAGSLTLLGVVSLNDTLDINKSMLNVGDTVFVNTTARPELNVSGRVVLEGLALTTPKIEVDYEDDGTFVDCPEPDCVIESFSAGTLVFTVAHFTSFQAAESGDPAAVPEFSTMVMLMLVGAVMVSVVAMRRRV